MRKSLRWRLFIFIALSVLLAWMATAFFTYRDAHREIGAALDERLKNTAAMLATQFVRAGGLNIDSHAIRDTTDRTLQIWKQDGTLLVSSSTASTTPLGNHHDGFGNATVDDVHYRVYSHWDDTKQINVRLGERYDLRYALAESVASHLLHPLYFAVPVLGLLIWLSVGVGLAPLSRFTHEVQQREPGKLDPLDSTYIPREAEPLLNALNVLFARLEESLEHERRFTADAAHELRTPLAAIKTQAQVAYASHDPAALKQALSNVINGADRATRLTEQLLMLSRLDPVNASVSLQSVKLSTIANECVALHAPVAIRKGVDLGFEADNEGRIRGDAALLAILVRNLIDNAVRYTPAGGQVDVQIKRTGDQIALCVADTGPGILEKERERVLSRFYRVLGSGEEGSGLGLSIAKRITELHGASLQLDNRNSGNGLLVTVQFKAPSTRVPVPAG